MFHNQNDHNMNAMNVQDHDVNNIKVKDKSGKKKQTDTDVDKKKRKSIYDANTSENVKGIINNINNLKKMVILQQKTIDQLKQDNMRMMKMIDYYNSQLKYLVPDILNSENNDENTNIYKNIDHNNENTNYDIEEEEEEEEKEEEEEADDN